MRLLLCLMLAVIAAPASAEWVKLRETDDAVFYIDPATIRKNGNFRRIWNLQDLKRRDPYGVMSRRMLYEYDCTNERSKVLSISSHYDRMGGGGTYASGSGPDEWDYIAPGTVLNTVLRIVCKK